MKYKMCRTQCVLALVMLSVGLVNSWDIVVIASHELKFYTNGTVTHSEPTSMFHDTKLVYDAVHDMVLFIERNNHENVVVGYNIATKKIQPLVNLKSEEYISNFGFDPVTELFFWIENSSMLYWISLKPNEFKNGMFLMEMNDNPYAIAVDSCGGYIYWTNLNNMRSTIERARFDGSEREIVIESKLYYPKTLAIDQQTQKLYWSDDIPKNIPTTYPIADDEFSIESADLNGKNRRILYVGKHKQPQALTVSKDSIYWLSGFCNVWQLPKNETIDAKPKKIGGMHYNLYGVATNYKIEEQTQGLQKCEALTSLLPNNSVTNDSLNIPTDVGSFCVHGTNVDEKSVCKCTPGYIGERCDVSVCQNYCFQGDCIVSAKGQPICRCRFASYSGERCEVNACHGYCLNNGVCLLNEKSEPACQCTGDYKGERCNVLVCQNYCFQGECNVSAEGQPQCRCSTGYSGQRCEVNACFNYCLNNGVCSLNEKDEPVCQCVGNHEGSRCEPIKAVTTITGPYDSAERTNLTLADLVSSWRKPTAKISVIVEL